MTFKPKIWYPIAAVLSAINLVSVWFFSMDPWHATAHAALAVAFGLWAQRLWKGRSWTRPAPIESTQRLERIEQAIEAVAIEVERISEGQRFVTRLLSEGNRLPGLTAGKREQEAVPTPER
jgi:glucose dehydrogenase